MFAVKSVGRIASICCALTADNDAGIPATNTDVPFKECGKGGEFEIAVLAARFDPVIEMRLPGANGDALSPFAELEIP